MNTAQYVANKASWIVVNAAGEKLCDVSSGTRRAFMARHGAFPIYFGSAAAAERAAKAMPKTWGFVR